MIITERDKSWITSIGWIRETDATPLIWDSMIRRVEEDCEDQNMTEDEQTQYLAEQQTSILPSVIGLPYRPENSMIVGMLSTAEGTFPGWYMIMNGMVPPPPSLLRERLIIMTSMSERALQQSKDAMLNGPPISIPNHEDQVAPWVLQEEKKTEGSD